MLYLMWFMYKIQVNVVLLFGPLCPCVQGFPVRFNIQ